MIKNGQDIRFATDAGQIKEMTFIKKKKNTQMFFFFFFLFILSLVILFFQEYDILILLDAMMSFLKMSLSKMQPNCQCKRIQIEATTQIAPNGVLPFSVFISIVFSPISNCFVFSYLYHVRTRIHICIRCVYICSYARWHGPESSRGCDCRGTNYHARPSAGSNLLTVAQSHEARSPSLPKGRSTRTNSSQPLLFFFPSFLSARLVRPADETFVVDIYTFATL